ncbi:acyl-[acyl-carrier-protein] thioesterase [Carboxylicivirga taeanensis]|uniref:acyl-[acyl-carrier-protein] thioesterase n=1 Tax=Carboxylicivirga taeanensis TaxID=1416875 RepID=UPI003F6DC1D4
MSNSTKSITQYTITSADTDMFSRLKVSALVNYLIQSAISSAEQLGFGFADLKDEHLFWVLNRLTIEIVRPVMWSEQVEVETWPKNVERIFYIRDFIVRDAQKQVVAKASSAWLAIDLKSKRPGTFNKEKMEVFTRLKDVHALSHSPEKLAAIPNCTSQLIAPSYFDIDLNKHVTSTRYIDWMMDQLSVDFHQSHYPQQLSVNYLKETMLGDTIALNHQQTNTINSFEGYNRTQDKVAFRGKITFRALENQQAGFA